MTQGIVDSLVQGVIGEAETAVSNLFGAVGDWAATEVGGLIEHLIQNIKAKVQSSAQPSKMAGRIVSASVSAISEMPAEIRKKRLVHKLWEAVKDAMSKSAASMKAFIPEQLKTFSANIKMAFRDFSDSLMQTLARGLVVTAANLGTKLLTPLLSAYILDPATALVETQARRGIMGQLQISHELWSCVAESYDR